MALDKYSAVWVSHSSITDFLNCPRAYYLRNVYKDPATGRKVSLVNPALALGQVIHEVLESLSVLPVKDRFAEPLPVKFARAWSRVSGQRGGFENRSQEEKFKGRGEAMVKKVAQKPGPLKRLAVKIQMDLPYFWLSEKEGIILCGKIDWLEYLPDDDAVHIIDFKTGKGSEKEGSLQLPIYHLLVHHCQQRKVVKASYWYLERNDRPSKQELPDLKTAQEKVLEVAKKIKLHRQLEKFDCPRGEDGCRHCQPLEKILEGEATFVGLNDFGQRVYILLNPPSRKAESKIL